MSKDDLLKAVASEIVVCRKCGLSENRRNAVPGEGNPRTQVMFIGEAPGYWEDVKGRPFIGAAGKLLDTLLSVASLSRETVFICNVLKCRPPRNREPRKDEIEACTPHLDKQIQIIQPEIVVPLGNYSTAYILEKTGVPFFGITVSHGEFHDVSYKNMQTAIFPTFHPAAALYSGKYRDLISQDFERLGIWISRRRQT